MKLGYPWCSEGHPRTTMRIEVHECHPTIWRCPECWATVEVIEEPALEDSAMYANEAFVRVSAMAIRRAREWSGPVEYRFVDGKWPEVGLEMREVERGRR